MKRSNLLDFLIVLLVYLAFSAFPFSRFIANGTVVIILQIVAQCFISTFMSFFLAKKSKLNHTLYKLNVKNTILLLPTVLVCFSNLLFMIFMNKGINISFGLGSILPIILTMTVVYNEEMIFRLLFINNYESKNKIKVIVVSAVIFGLCHLTSFLSSFNPADLIIVAYTFLLGLLLAFAYIYSNSVMVTILIHFFFNLFNNHLFGYFEISFMYILVNALVALFVGLYVSLLYLKKYKKAR